MKAELFEIPVTCISRSELLNLLAQKVEQQDSTHLVTMNAEMAYNASLDHSFHALLKQADLVIPDGIGVVWALGREGIQQERLPGVEITQALLHRAPQQNWRVGILGGKPDLKEALLPILKERFQLVPHYYQHGYFSPDEAETIQENIQEAQLDILFVALGVPRQEKWIAEHRKALGIPLMIGVGGSFDVISGRLERAPEWMQKAHLEWFFRLLQEPTRWKRMLALPKFVLKVLRG